MTNAERYIKFKFHVENNALEFGIFFCVYFLAISIGDKAETLLGIVLTAFPIWFFFREKVSSDILLIPISYKEMKRLNMKYRGIKFLEWISFGTVCYILQRFSKSIAYSIGFFIIFSILYWVYVFTKFLKREL